MNKNFEAYSRHWNSYGFKFEIITTHDEYVFMKRNDGACVIYSELFKDIHLKNPEWWSVNEYEKLFNELTIKYNVDWGEHLARKYCWKADKLYLTNE